MLIWLKSGYCFEASNSGKELETEVINDYLDARFACQGEGPISLNFYLGEEEGMITVPRDEISAVTDLPVFYMDDED